METEDNKIIIFEECTNVSNEDNGIAVCGGIICGISSCGGTICGLHC